MNRMGHIQERQRVWDVIRWVLSVSSAATIYLNTINAMFRQGGINTDSIIIYDWDS